MRLGHLSFTGVAILLLVATDGDAEDVSHGSLPSEMGTLFKQHCIACHGPARQEGGLNLATPPGIRRGGKKGEVIAGGSLERSRLWRLVAADKMPPEKPLSSTEKDQLRRWILAGTPGLPERVSPAAHGDEHWAFQRLPALADWPDVAEADSSSTPNNVSMLHVPKVADSSRVRTQIDQWIQAGLERHGLSLGSEADRETLLRRVSLDLTGLPPTPDERREFLNDPHEDAYERMVDRYLASQRFGERWGKYWLDAAGYADSNGYFGADTDRPLAYRYRDYVIRSLNADKPWDQFVLEQLAGDELAGFGAGVDVQPEMLPLLDAVHFLRNSPDGTDSSDGNPDEVRRDRYAAIEGTLEIMGASLLGMTVGCARCHDHKFEPFSQRDYYQLQAVIYPAFNVANWIKPKDRTVRAASTAELSAWQSEVQRIDAAIAARHDEFRQWLRGHREPSETVFTDDFDGDGRKLAGSWNNTVPGDAAPGGTPAVTIDTPNAPAALVEDGRLQIIESGAAGDRVCCTTRTFDWTPPQTGDWIQVTFDLGARGTPAPYVGYFVALCDFNDARGLSGGNVLLDGRQSGQAAVHLDYPGGDSVGRGSIGTSGYEPGRNLGVRITNVGGGRFELAQVVDGIPEPGVAALTADDLPDGAFGFEYCCNRSFTIDNVLIEQSLRAPATPSEITVDELRAEIAQQRAALNADITRLERSRPAEPGHLAIVADYSPEIPAVPLLIRGEHQHAGEVVPAAVPHVFVEPGQTADLDRIAADWPGRAQSTGRRLAFADWLTQADSRAAGLLARVTVNRWWQYHFGRGIVATPENLGYSGAAPTHPELLDFLAAKLVDLHWSPKALHRLILQSAVYRQSSIPQTQAQRVDPENLLLWRYPLRRLDAEAIRDSMLAVSGELDRKMFGPYVPTEYASDGSVVVAMNAAGRQRRSIYLQQRRTQTPDVLKVFDAPSIVSSCTGRPRTTVPLQSLNLLNSPFIRTCAEALAVRIDAGSDMTCDEFLTNAFVAALSREPRPAERTASLEFLNEQPNEYSDTAGAVRRARVDFCQMLLAGNSFLYVE
ncbi:DUF1553 domain-containing protein [bacterium]|nr:DUF1553 domain-containing protein [bacterium]